MRAFSPHYSYLIQLGLCGVEHIYDLLKKNHFDFKWLNYLWLEIDLSHVINETNMISNKRMSNLFVLGYHLT